jgi:glycine betaine/proline transport system ATP-binding protein
MIDANHLKAPGIQIRSLYKIFGPRAHEHLDAVRQGLGKDELNERHKHVLGLCDVNIDMPPSAITVVMGLSGSGKSTLLRHVNRLMEPTAGQVMVGETDVTALDTAALQAFRRKNTGMVFQRFALFPHRSVLRNVQYALEVQGMPAGERDKASRAWIERVGLAGYENSYPSALSGGMQQRVGLARALAGDAPILLMDEAFSALDPLIRVEMQDLVLELQRDLHKTVVFITHDLDEALRLGDHIVILRDGQVIQQGAAQDIVLAPADDYVRRFVRDVNRGKVLRCGTLAQLGPAVQGPTLEADAPIADAARALQDAGVSHANVRAGDGRMVGTLSLRAVVDQLVA